MRLSFFAFAVLALTSSQAMAQKADPSVEAQFCRSQLELLVSGGKLTPEEEARFDMQCACLEKADPAGDHCTAASGTH